MIGQHFATCHREGPRKSGGAGIEWNMSVPGPCCWW